MTVLQQIRRVLIIRYQKASGSKRLLKQRQQRFQITRRGPLSDHDSLSLTNAFYCLLRRRTLVIITDSSRNVSVQRLPRKEGRMSVYQQSPFQCSMDLVHYSWIACEYSGIIHHLTQSQHSGMAVELHDIFRFQPGSGLIKFCRRNTGRDHHIYRHRKPLTLTLLQHVTDSCRSTHIGNLMRIRDHCRRSVRNCRAGKFRRQQHRTLNVDVGINKARAYIHPRNVRRLVGIRFSILSESDNPAVLHQHIAFFQLSGKNIDHGSILKQPSHS